MKVLKQSFALFLSFILLLSATGSCISAFAADTVEIVAVSTVSAAVIDGNEVNFNTYTINGGNYFKLRDIAYMLNGTAKQFEISWNGEKDAISLLSGKAYTGTGGEMSERDNKNINAVPAVSKIYLDGKEINLSGYTVGGNNYFMINEIGVLFDFRVEYDSENNTVIIDTGKRYAYITENITIGKRTEYELKGLLTIPSDANSENPCPAVVMVQGSGSSDMDETIFANKPFRDIAEYLSSNGIAVIRYDKRTFTHGVKMVQELGGSLTVYEETIEDAILATEILKSDPRINKDKVFIIGHSLGGMLAPRIHAEGGDYAGIISLAGSPRFLLDIMKDQNIAAIEETMEGDEKKQALAAMKLWDIQVSGLLSLSDEDAKAVDLGGASAYYFKDLYEHPASEYIKDITVPFLIMQGSKDFQVYPDKDFAAWQELLNGRSDVTFKLYEGLNHLFMTSAIGKVSQYMEEYKIPNHVNGQVLSDIAEWIKLN